MLFAVALSLYFVFAAALIYAIFGGFLYGAMYMKLPEKQVQQILMLGGVEKGKVTYDLGAGFGNIAFQAAQRGACVFAVEADWFKAWWIKRQTRKQDIPNIEVIHDNLLHIDLSNADVLLCYLSDSLMNHLSKAQLKHGCIIVSCCHRIKKWTPTQTIKHPIYPIYVYRAL